LKQRFNSSLHSGTGSAHSVNLIPRVQLILLSELTLPGYTIVSTQFAVSLLSFHITCFGGTGPTNRNWVMIII